MALMITKFDEVCKVSTSQVRIAISPARVSSYLSAQRTSPPCLDKALALYRWNVELSGAVLWHLSSCEIVIRNAVADALEARYGAQWPWATGFRYTLNATAQRFLDEAKRKAGAGQNSGKVIAELNFGFWEKMFKAAFDADIWNRELHRVFPNLSEPLVQVARADIFQNLQKIRKLRNRVAHHEPLFKSSVQPELDTVQKLVKLRCADTAAWIARTSTVSTVLLAKPV